MPQSIAVTVNGLIDKAWEHILSLGRAEKTNYMYKNYGIVPVRLYFSAEKIDTYSEEAGNVCIQHHLVLLQNKEINTTKFRYVRKTIVIMTSIFETGDYVWSYEPSIHTVKLSAPLKKILDDYEKNYLVKRYRATTIRVLKPVIKHFLVYLDSLGFDDLMNLSVADISSYIPVLAESYARIGDCFSLLRTFGTYLTENSLCNLKLETLFKIKVPSRKKIYTGFDTVDVTSILGSPDRDTALGKRDYAVMMLATYTGLRGVDVLTLKFSDIDWNAREIHLIQSKTSVELILPVPVSVLNALAEYILEARPGNHATDIIFLRSRSPYDPLRTWSAHSIVKRNASKAGIVWTASERKGIHSLRRTLATDMLASDVPIDTIKDILGQSSIDATKPYISIEISGLDGCPLTLDHIDMGRRELK